MRHLTWLVPLGACLGCSAITGEKRGTSYGADFSVQFVEAAVHVGTVRLECFDTYQLSGHVTVTIDEERGAGSFGDGSVRATQKHLSMSGADCKPTPDRDTGSGWTAELTGTPSQPSLVVQRVGTGTFPYTTRFEFTGTRSGDEVTGTLVFKQTAQGITGGTTQSTSNAQASVSLTLRK